MTIGAPEAAAHPVERLILNDSLSKEVLSEWHNLKCLKFKGKGQKNEKETTFSSTISNRD
jgi:hypothetical protein